MPQLPELPVGTSPRAEFERVVTAALERHPCIVSFSGGRDSSAVLAVAADVARREGLPLPIPITHRFPAAGKTEESAWQEQVVAHLGLEDWIRLEVADELDSVGRVAGPVLRRHGLLWPCNAYFHVPILEAARGGTLMTGIGGDEAFSPSTWSHQLAVLGRQVRPVPRDLLRVGFALSPASIKAPLIRRRLPRLWPWLTPDARDRVKRWIAADAAREPVRWRERYRHLAASPVTAIGLASLAALAQDVDAAIAHPFSDSRFLATLAGLTADRRPRSRTEAMDALVGDLLPESLVRRGTKATFAQVFWGEESRALMATWDGVGVDTSLVDVERLREEWNSPDPDTYTVTLLQSVWLTGAGQPARPPRTG